MEHRNAALSRICIAVVGPGEAAAFFASLGAFHVTSSPGDAVAWIAEHLG